MAASPRLQIASLFAGYGAAGVFWGAFAAATPAFQQQTGLGPGGFGLALGALAVAALPVMQVFGRVVHRIQALAIPLSMAAFAAGNLLLAASDTLPVFLAALILLGASSGALDIALNLRTARVEEDTGARLFNRTHALFPVAVLAASAATGWLRGAGVPTGAIFPGVAGLFALAALLERHAGRHQGPERMSPEEPARGRLPLALPAIVLGLTAALGAFQEAATQSWGAIFVEVARGAGPALSGLAPAAFTLGLSLGRLGAHALDTRLRPMTAVRLAACLALPGFLAAALLSPVWALLAAFLLAGIGVGPIEPAVFRAVARRHEGAARGRTLAAVTAIAYLGYLVSPPALGWIADVAGFPALWATTAFAAAAVALLTLIVPRA